ncbi:MAG: hypothetical protein JXB17_13465 [Bacteroidales bacterium]|nr:hypothetical protein [Bacteroidales bacterium]
MKTNKYNTNYKWLLIGAFLIAGFTSKAQVYTENSHIVKSYKVNTSSTIEVYNKYGKLHVVTWDKDSVKFEVNLTVKSSSKSKLEKVRDNITFDFTGTEYFITAKSIFGSKYNSFFNDLADFAGSFMTSDNQVEINYTILLPEYVNIKLNNKFGDIYIENVIGDISISLSNGDLKGGNFEGNTNIQLLMGNGEINSLKNGKIYTSYSDLNIKTIDQINIDSKLSRINIDKSNIIRLDSKKDKIYVNELSQLFGEAYFSDIWIYNLNTKANFNMKYGNMNLETIKKEFKFIDFKSEYTDINLFFQSGSAYDVDITHKGTYLRYPEEIAQLKEETINEEDSEFYTFGKIGNAETASKLKINALKGNINIFHK